VVGQQASCSLANSFPVDNNTWTTTNLSITVPNTDHEVYFIVVSFPYRTAGGSGLTVYPAKLSLYDETDGKYYPIDSSTDGVPVYYIGGNEEFRRMTMFFTIPKNVKNHVLKLRMWQNSGGELTVMGATMMGWGHSPHAHR
jgi:hypothetical protein